jgi:plastocyanin
VAIYAASSFLLSFTLIPAIGDDAFALSDKKYKRTASVAIVADDSGDSLSSGRYVPDDITVKKKTTVTWTNTDPAIRHTVTEGSEELTTEGHIPLFDSGPLSPGGTFSYTFNHKGEFYYYCNIHPSITGEVTVR